MPTGPKRHPKQYRRLMREITRMQGKNISIAPLFMHYFPSLYSPASAESGRKNAQQNMLRARSQQNAELSRGKSDFISRRSRPRDMSVRPWNKGDKMSSKKKQK